MPNLDTNVDFFLPTGADKELLFVVDDAWITSTSSASKVVNGRTTYLTGSGSGSGWVEVGGSRTVFVEVPWRTAGGSGVVWMSGGGVMLAISTGTSTVSGNAAVRTSVRMVLITSVVLGAAVGI